MSIAPFGATSRVSSAAGAHAPAGQYPRWAQRPVSSGLRVQAHYPTTETCVLTVAGDVDAATLPHLNEVLTPRLTSMVCAVVVDLSGVGFLSLSAARWLGQAATLGQQRGIKLSVVVASHAVRHTLRAASMDTTLDCHPTVPAALASAQDSETDAMMGRHTARQSMQKEGHAS